MKVMVTELPENEEKCPFHIYQIEINDNNDILNVPICNITKQSCNLKDGQCNGLYKF